MIEHSCDVQKVVRDPLTVFNLLVEHEGLRIGIPCVTDTSLRLKHPTKIGEIASLASSVADLDIDVKSLFVMRSCVLKVTAVLQEQSYVVEYHRFSTSMTKVTIQTQSLLII